MAFSSTAGALVDYRNPSMPSATGAALALKQGGLVCRKRKHWNALGKTPGKESRPAPRPENSYAKRCTTSGKASMERRLPSRLLQSDFPRPGEPASSWERRAKERNPPMLQSKPIATWKKGKAILAASRLPRAPEPHSVPSKRKEAAQPRIVPFRGKPVQPPGSVHQHHAAARH